MKRILAALALFVCGNATAELPGELFAATFIGKGNMDIGSEYTLDGYDETSNYMAIGAQAGYRFASNIAVSLYFFNTLSGGTFFQITDDYRVIEEGIQIGYTFDLHKHLKITPKIGRGYWTLKVKEGLLFSGEVIEEQEFKGNDSFWQLQVEVPFNRLFQMYLSYEQKNYEFGQAARTDLGFKFEFL